MKGKCKQKTVRIAALIALAMLPWGRAVADGPIADGGFLGRLL